VYRVEVSPDNTWAFTTQKKREIKLSKPQTSLEGDIEKREKPFLKQ